MDYSVFPIEEPELPQEGRELPENVQKYLEKIIELCETNGVELVTYTAPYGYTGEGKESFMNKQRINLALEEYLKVRGIPYFNLQKTNAPGFDYASDFRDYAHMNSYGADKVTRYLSEFLVKNYDLPDHRQDAAYASWNDDYEEFRQAMMSSLGGE